MKAIIELVTERVLVEVSVVALAPTTVTLRQRVCELGDCENQGSMPPTQNAYRPPPAPLAPEPPATNLGGALRYARHPTTGN